MARLPTLDQRPTPRFGGALQAPQGGEVEQAVSELGSSIAGFGEILMKEKIKDDKYRTEDATTKLQQRMLDLSKGEEGYSQYKSGDVANNKKFYEEYMTRFEVARKEIEESLGNDDQKKLFSRRGDVAKIGYGEGLINHITKEKDVFNEQVYKGGVATELDVAATEYSNENIVKSAILRTTKLTEAESERTGLPADVSKMVLKENISNIHTSVIQQAVDDGNHQYAKDWFKKNQKDILGEQQDNVKKLLRESGIRVKSQGAVDDYVAKGLTEKEAKAEARKNYSGEEEDAVITRIESRYNESNEIRDRKQKNAGEQVWAIYGETKNIDDVPLSLLRDMDGKERVAFEATVKQEDNGVQIPSGSPKYYELMQLVSEDPAEFKKENLNKYRHLMSPGNLTSLINLQTNEKEIKLASTKTQIMDRGAFDAGLNPTQANKDTGAGEKVRAYYDRVNKELEAFQISTGKEATSKDIKEITDRLSIEVIRNPEAWFFSGERPAVKAEIKGVPSEMIDEIAQVLINIGQPVTDENILKQWNYINGR